MDASLASVFTVYRDTGARALGVTVPAGSEAGVSPNGRWVAIVSPGDSAATIRLYDTQATDVAGSLRTSTTPGAPTPTGVAVSDDGPGIDRLEAYEIGRARRPRPALEEGTAGSERLSSQY